MVSQEGHLYVIDNLRHLIDVKAGGKTWWCVEPATKAGELSAIYVKQIGIKILFQTTGATQTCVTFCNEYDLAAAPIEIIKVFSKPIQAKILRVHPKLRNLPGLTRNFQGKSFKLPSVLFDELQQIKE